MRKLSVPVVYFACLTASLLADDGLPPKTLAAIKRAAVFVEVEVEGLSGSGSGFVVMVDGPSALVVTNHHVVEPKIIAQARKDSNIILAARPRAPSRISRPALGTPMPRHPNVRDLPPDFTPRFIIRTLKNAAVTVIFDSGTKDERSAKAELLAIDPDYDLAVMRVKDVKNLPEPIHFEKEVELAETMAVYTFGFPFGKVLATGKGHPAMTVGKAAISSLREDDDGELAIVQIDGGLNPGNSGGPIVTTQGELVGVAVATIRNSNGIGLAIPAGQLRNMFAGRIGAVHLASQPNAKKPAIAIEVGVIDPLNKIKSVELHSIGISRVKVNLDKGIESLEGLPGCEKTKLTLEKQLASGEMALATATSEKDFLVQSVYTTADGKTNKTRVFRQPLQTPAVVATITPDQDPATPQSGDSAGKSGGGTAKSRDSASQGDNQGSRGKSRETANKSQGRATKNSTSPFDPFFKDQAPEKSLLVGFDLGLGGFVGIELVKAMRPIYRAGKGKDVFGKSYGTNLNKVVRVKAKAGYAVGGMTIRAGSLVNGLSLIFMRVKDGKLDPTDSYESEWIGDTTGGSEKTVQGDGAPVIGVSGRMNEIDLEKFELVFDKNAGSAKAPPRQNEIAGDGGRPERGSERTGDATKILGGGSKPAFKDQAPENGLLVGLEIGLGNFGNLDVVKAIRPIYRTDDDETLGNQYGTPPKNVVVIKAKPGYAVGSMTVRSGLVVDGLSVTFMRVLVGKLDPADSYQSDWIGNRTGGSETTLKGDGTQVIGIVGKASDKECTGIGLLFEKN